MADYDSEDFMNYGSEDSFEYSDDDDLGFNDEDKNVKSSDHLHSSQGVSQNAEGTQNLDEFYDYDDDDLIIDNGGFEPVISNRQKKKSWEVDFRVHGASSLRTKQQEIVSRLGPLLSLTQNTTVMLLHCYLWKEEALVENYLNDPERTLSKNGLYPNPEPAAIHTGSSDFVCEICFCDGSEEEYISLPCSHRYCAECYTRYISGKIYEGESWRIKCPAHKCPALVGEQIVRLLLANDKDGLNRYENNLTRSFVNDLECFSWCPAPNCEYSIECHVPRSSWMTIVPVVKCSCGNMFCFGCKRNDHLPTPCYIVEKWIKKCKDDSETSNWIKANTKECTKCKATIEKNGGCNHMTCRECRYEFCWVCMGPWAEHGQAWYQCNRFNEDSSKGARDQISKSRASLERYLHYYTRYNNHEQSAKLARKLVATTESNMEQMQRESTMSWIEVQFLSDAVDVLTICRTTLKWSYVLAYYMDKSIQKEIFETNQSDLEMATEHLNDLVENPTKGHTIEEVKRLVIDKTNYVKTRRETLLSDIATGLQENRWTFNI